jgi:hypothetical protein
MTTAEQILDDIDNIMLTMRPRHCGQPSMDGKYPCWIVWLPGEGGTTRKSLKQAFLDYQEQSEKVRADYKAKYGPADLINSEQP